MNFAGILMVRIRQLTLNLAVDGYVDGILQFDMDKNKTKICDMSFKTDGITFKLFEPLYLHVLIYYPLSYPTKMFFFYQNVQKKKLITFAFK